MRMNAEGSGEGGSGVIMTFVDYDVTKAENEPKSNGIYLTIEIKKIIINWISL